VSRFAPDIVILENCTNDLSSLAPEVVGSNVDELVKDLIEKFSVRVVCLCLVIPWAADNVQFNKKAKVYNDYVQVVLGDISNIFLWSHKGLNDAKQEVLIPDGVHLNANGQYKLYRSYRGVILHALNLLKSLNDA